MSNAFVISRPIGHYIANILKIGTGKYGKSGADRPGAGESEGGAGGAATGSDSADDCLDCTAGQFQVRALRSQGLE